MGRKNKSGYTLSEKEKIALGVVINSGELENPVSSMPYVYDVTEWFTPKENGRRNEETSAEFYELCHGDQVFGTYIEGNKDSKTERQFCESLERAGYVQQIGDGYYLWAAQVEVQGENDIWNRQTTMDYVQGSWGQKFHEYNNETIEISTKIDNLVSFNSKDEAYVEIPKSNAKSGNTEPMIEAVEKVEYITRYLPEDDPRRIEAEAIATKAEQMSLKVNYGTSGAYDKDGYYVSAKSALKEKGYDVSSEQDKATPAELRAFNIEARQFLNEANANGTISEAYDIAYAKAQEEYKDKHHVTTTEADVTTAVNLAININADTNSLYMTPAEKEIAAQEATHYMEVTTHDNYYAPVTFINQEQQKVADVDLPGYAQYIEKKEDHVETQRDEATHATIREVNSINVEVRNETIGMVREYIEQYPDGRTNVELMRDADYQQLMHDIKNDILDAGRREVDTIDSGLKDLATLTSPASSEEQINALVSSEINGITYNDRIMNNAAILNTKIEKVVREDIIQGKSYTQIKNDITNVFNSAAYANGRLITTEAARVEDRAIKEALKEEGVEEVELIAESDACDECLSLTGKTYSIDDAPEVPVHPNCRCVIRAIVKK